MASTLHGVASPETPIGERPVQTVNALGVRVSTASLDDIALRIADVAEGDLPKSGPGYVCATSVHGLIEGRRDPEFRRILNDALMVTPDGMPLVWFGRLLGQRSMTRVYGPSLTLRVCELTAGRAVRHFFYGGAPGVAEELARRLTAQFPGFSVAGTYSPPFRLLSDSERLKVADIINASDADVVWVGLSTPKQERWIDSIRELLRVKVLLSVGAAFDFHTGRLKQAPSWMQRSGLEWLYRLTREPRRLWRRYAYNNPRFLYLAAIQLLGLRDFSDTRT